MKIKIFIWQLEEAMLGEEVKKWGWARFCHSCNYIPGHYTFFCFFYKLKNLYTSACSNLNYGTTNSHQKCKGRKDGGNYQNFLPIPSQV